MLRDATEQLRPGTRVVVEGHRLGHGRRRGEILEVLGEPGRERCRIQWEDGSETLVYAGAGLRIETTDLDGQEELE